MLLIVNELWLIRPFAVLPPRRFAPWLVRHHTWYHCDTTTETLCLMCANQLKAGRDVSTAETVPKSGYVRPRCVGESARGAKEPGGESSRGRKSQIPL